MEIISGETAIRIDAESNAVYAYLADFTRHPEWVANVSKVSPLTPGPAQVGSRYRANEGAPPVSLGRRVRSMVHLIRGLIGGAKPYSEAEITALEPGRRIAWSARLPAKYGAFNKVDWELALSPDGSGTLLTQRFACLPQTPAARQMIAALGDSQGIANACLVSLTKLKSVLEREPDGAARPVTAPFSSTPTR